MKNVLMAMAMVVSMVFLGGCGANSAPKEGSTSTIVDTSTTGKATFRIPFSPEARAQAALGKSMAMLPAGITVADIVAKEKTKVTSVNIRPYSIDGDFNLPSMDYEIVNGWLIATMDVPAGKYRFSLSCSDADGWEVFYGYSNDVAVVVGQPSEADVTLELDSVAVDFVISGMPVSFDKSTSAGDDGVTYKVDTTVLNNLGYGQDDSDWYAYVDSDGALHFSVRLSVYQDIPAKITLSVKDNTGKSFTQTLNVDGQTLLNAIYNEQSVSQAYEPTGTVNFNVSFKGE